MAKGGGESLTEHKYLREEEGRELRALRIRAGLTQVELAAAVRMTPLSIVMAEHGKKALNDAARVKVMAHLAIVAGRTEWQLK